MSDPKVIARLLCARCDPSNRRVIARLIDTPRGAALRANLRRRDSLVGIVENPVAMREVHDELTLVDMPPLDPDGSSWTFGVNPAVVVIGCPKHDWMAVTGDWLREIEEEYRRTGRPVVRVVHPPSTP